MMLHHDEDEAIRRGVEGANFFGYSLGHFYVFGDAHARHDQRVAGVRRAPRPRRATTPRRSRARSRTSALGAKVAAGDTTGLRGCIGTPDQVARVPPPLRGGRRRPGDLRAAGRPQPARAHHGVDRALRPRGAARVRRARRGGGRARSGERLAPRDRGGARTQGGARTDDGHRRLRVPRAAQAVGRRPRTTTALDGAAAASSPTIAPPGGAIRHAGSPDDRETTSTRAT